MPSTIPYDPSLVLGNLVSQAKLDNLVQISQLQAPADAAEDELNSLIALRRSLDMTTQELLNLNIDSQDLYAATQDVNKQVAEAAKNYAKAKLAAEKAIQPLKAKIGMISDEIESPIDYNKSEIKPMPLAADSLKMNVQYFSYDENSQSSSTHAATISTFVSEETKFLGDDFSAEASASAAAQTNSQHERHSVAGTLVISVVCTHKQAQLFAPFIIDVDKGIRAWNRIHPDVMIKTDSISNVAKIAAEANTPQEKSITLLSGATYGSCYIGMVHVLNTTDTQSSEQMYSIAAKMQAQFKIGGWFSSESGGFGVDSTFSNDTKNLLSTQNITAHCTLVTSSRWDRFRPSSRIRWRGLSKGSQTSTPGSRCRRWRRFRTPPPRSRARWTSRQRPRARETRWCSCRTRRSARRSAASPPSTSRTTRSSTRRR
jgi:hypothetical protein